jgi:hypothetical protein
VAERMGTLDFASMLEETNDGSGLRELSYWAGTA